MKTRIVVVMAAWVLGSFLVLPTAAQGKKLYKWVDENGKVHYSDTVPADQLTKGRQEISGASVKTVDRQKTSEELAADRLAAEKIAEQKKLDDATAQADNALMLSYAEEADLLRARDQELDVVDSALATNKLGISSHEKALTDMLASAAEFERAKKVIPKTVTDSIAKIRKDLDDQKKMYADREASKATIMKEYEKKVARYRELKAKAAK
ncbi:MAG: DUF4124 domain-containing protein [Ahniella sp.]|nr:DUF4124 domain-containing protein [Ahniella sp.]